jgi:hypothetical protein
VLAGTRAGVMYHGNLSPGLEVRSSAVQGSPFSRLLYVLAAQPLAARLRQLQAMGVVEGIPLPDGTLAPPCHQHADDTILCTLPRCKVLRLPWSMRSCPLIGAASNVRLSLPKCIGMLQGPGAEEARGVEHLTQVPYVAPGGHVRHLGILLSATDQLSATYPMFRKRLTVVRLQVRCWARFRLSYLGRLHVAISRCWPVVCISTHLL